LEKSEIDGYFSREWCRLERKVRQMHRSFRGHGDPMDIMQEAYLELLSKAPRMQGESDCEAYLVQYVRGQLVWPESKHNYDRTKQARRLDQLSPAVTVRVHTAGGCSELEQSDDGVCAAKVEMERWYDACRSAVERYRASDIRRRFLIDLYIELDGSTRMIAERLQISKHSAWEMIKQMKQAIKKIREQECE
jgi:hypothetical protein